MRSDRHPDIVLPSDAGQEYINLLHNIHVQKVDTPLLTIFNFNILSEGIEKRNFLVNAIIKYV